MILVQENSLVVGTSNKSELLFGYGTIFGDLACAINPIGDIYKSDLFELAKYLGVNDNILKRHLALIFMKVKVMRLIWDIVILK